MFPGLAVPKFPHGTGRLQNPVSVWHTEQVLYSHGLISGAYAVTAFQTAPGLMAAMFMDITSRKRTEDELRESEELLRLFIEHAPAALAMLDKELCYIAASSRWIADNHLGDRDLIGHSHLESFPDLPKKSEMCSAAVLLERSHLPMRIRSNGWMDPSSGSHGKCAHGRLQVMKIGGVIIFSEDITRRKNAEMQPPEKR